MTVAARPASGACVWRSSSGLINSASLGARISESGARRHNQIMTEFGQGYDWSKVYMFEGLQ